MNYHLLEHNRGYNLTTTEAFSLLTTTAVPFALRHQELARTQEDNWLGHRVLFIAECLPIIGILVAAIEYLVASCFHRAPNDIPSDSLSGKDIQPIVPTPLSPTVNHKIVNHLKNDPMRPISARTTTPTDEPIPALPMQFSTADTLLREAQDYFNSADIPAPLTFGDIDAENLSEKELIEALLQKYDGLCIGEYHNDSVPKYFLTVHMPLFRSLGVDTLYLEGYDGLENELEAYSSGNTTQPPEQVRNRIMRFIGYSDADYNEIDVLMAAKLEGIRIVNIDSKEARKAPKGGLLRTAAMNYQAKLIIEQDRAQHPGGKSIIYAGSAHTNRLAGVPGLGQMFQFPAITLHDSYLMSGSSYSIAKEIETDSHMDPRMESFDFLIRMKKPLKP